jgi:hypothetical protein
MAAVRSGIAAAARVLDGAPGRCEVGNDRVGAALRET